MKASRAADPTSGHTRLSGKSVSLSVWDENNSLFFFKEPTVRLRGVTPGTQGVSENTILRVTRIARGVLPTRNKHPVNDFLSDAWTP